MSLAWILLLPLAGGLAAWIAGRRSDLWPRWISLGTALLHLLMLLVTWGVFFARAETAEGGWLMVYKQPWIPQLGISFHLAVDGLSLLLLLLTSFLTVLAVLTSWTSVTRSVGFFHFNLLLILTALSGVFIAFDLFLFFAFWEISLLPLYFLIGIWGYENRVYATTKFFIITQGSGLLMLLAILGLVVVHWQSTGVMTFDYLELVGTPMSDATAWWLMLGFFIAFAVKLPVVPFHTWLPDAHTQAPTAGSVALAGLVLKIGAYGMLRFVMPLFPQAAADFALVAMILAVVGILYGALLALGQTDLKRMVAYTSISHMGFVLLGIFAWNELALQGAVIIMLSHGFSAAALFMLVGDLQHRTHTRDLGRFGGLWNVMPRMGGVGLFFAMASLGLPGLASFIGEFLVLMGAFQVNVPLTVLASVGLVAATVYSLWMMQKVYYGANTGDWKLDDTNGREMAVMASLIGATLWLGLYPQPVLTTSGDALAQMRQFADKARKAASQEVRGAAGSLPSASARTPKPRVPAGGGREAGTVAAMPRDGGSLP